MNVGRRSALGRGLDSLIPPMEEAEPSTDAEVVSDAGSASVPQGVQEVPLDDIRANPYQPRVDFDDEALGGLAASIEALGVLQPLLVRPADHGTYHLIAGERRWRAARRAGLDVGGVTPEAVIPGEKYDTYRYTVTIIGGYHQFGEFLANVGSLARVVAPVNFSIVSNAPGRAQKIKTSEKDALASTITLQTYVERTLPAKPAAAKERSS